MVRMGISDARASASGEQAAQRKRKEMEKSAGLASAEASASVPPAEDPPVGSELLPLVPVGPGRVVSVEEEESAGPPLKRSRVRIVGPGDRPHCPAGRAGAKKRSEAEGGAVSAKPGSWEPAISLSKDASLGDLEVSRYLAERVTPPVDERAFEKKNNLELGSQLVRLGMRVATGSFAVLQRLETLDQEVQDLHEQTKGLKDELAEVEEGRDLLQAKNESLEEEKKDLLARLAKAEEEKEEERREKEMEKRERKREGEEWKRTVREERELIKGLRRDCQAAMVGRDKALETVKWQRVEAIKRWRRRFLYEESLELACDVALSILHKGYQLHVPEGSSCPSFEEYAVPLIPPAFGLSLEEMMKKIEGEPTEVPDDELDLSSEEGEPRIGDVPSSPPGSISAPVVLLDEEELPSGDVPLAASSGPPVLAEPLPAEASPERPPLPDYSPGYTPSPPADI